MDDDLPTLVSDLMTQLETEDLDSWSKEALEERVARMQAEIARTEAAIDDRGASRSAAEALFR